MPSRPVRTATAPVEPPSPDRAEASATARVCELVREELLHGRLAAGQPLMELDLARRFAAARSTVREALGRLEAEGLLVRGLSRGLAVRRLDRKDVEDLYALRELLEGMAARRCAETGALPTVELAAERRIWRAVARDGAGASFSEANRAFHGRLIAACGNRHLPGLLDRTLMILFACQFRSWMGTESMAAAAADHLQILDALVAADGAAAERAMRAHVRRSAERILSLPERAFV